MPNLDGWNRIANAIYLASVAVAAAASVAIYQISSRVGDAKDREFRDFKQHSDEAIAKANERSQTLDKETEIAKLEQERLKASLAWRTLTREQSDSLLKAASENPGPVNLRYTDGDPEALFLAIQIGNILGAAHWHVAPGAIKFQNALAFGIRVNGEKLDTIQNVLNAGHLSFSTALWCKLTKYDVYTS